MTRKQKTGEQKQGKRRSCSPEVVEWLRQYYPTHPTKWCAEQLGVTPNAVTKMANRHGIHVAMTEDDANRQSADPDRGTVPYRQWIHKHDGDIRREYPDRQTDDMAGEYGVNYYTVSRRASRLGTAKSEAYMRARWSKGGAGNKGRQKAKKTESSDEYLKAHFADTRNEDLARHFRVDVKTVRRWARRLGLVKSEAFMRRSHAGNRSYYTPEQKAWRMRHAAEAWHDGDRETVRRTADELGISVRTLMRLAYEAGVCRSEERVRHERTEGVRRRTKYSAEFIEALREYYPTHTNKECAEKFGVDPHVLGALAHNHGISKDRGHLSRVHSIRSTAMHMAKGHRTKKQATSRPPAP